MSRLFSTHNHNDGRRNPLGVVGAWTDRMFQRRALATLDHRMMSDIGVSSSDRDRECRKPFWRG